MLNTTSSMYTSIEKVRLLSGFNNTTRIPNTVIIGKIRTAEGAVNGAIAKRYVLPIPYHRQVTITFAGTGSGTATMSVVVNGVTYSISISTGTTAEQCAQQMRDMVSSDFYTDQIDDTAKATLISKSDSGNLTTANAQVNVATIVTAGGITATISAKSDRHCPLVDEVTAEYAAGLLLYQNYGVEAQNTPNDGSLRLDKAGEAIARIAGISDDGKVDVLLDEFTNVEFTTLETFSPTGLPNDTTNADATNSTMPYVTANMRF